MSHQFVGKTNIFLDTSKQEGEKGEPVFVSKKTKKESHKKKREAIFPDQKKNGQTKCKKMPGKKGNRHIYF